MLRDEIARYTELSGNDGEHTPIGIIGAYLDGYEKGRKALIDDVKAEIAEEICLTDNPYTKETKYTIEHSKLLEILDNIGKAESEE